MKIEKKNGSFYTPKNIAKFLVSYLSKKMKGLNSISVLEPSAGDGVFVESLIENKAIFKKISRIVAVEKNKKELNKILINNSCEPLSVIHSDFLNFQKNNKTKYSLVIGNPPYIKKGLLRKSQIQKCEDIHAKARLKKSKTNNIWTSFLVRGIEFTDEKGILALILPLEFLQIKFAGELRELIINEFERIEIFTFNELLFKDCKGQDTLIFIGERKSNEKGVFYCNFATLSDISIEKVAFNKKIIFKETKWTYFYLESEEILLLEKLKAKIQTINYYSNSKAGIVTAANDFFIINSNTVEEFSLSSLVKPIIQNAALVNGTVVLSEEDFQLLVKKAAPTYLVLVENSPNIFESNNLKSYLEIGQNKGIDKRYKTIARKNWYEVPYVKAIPDAFFFRRCSDYPKFIINGAKVLATDTAYTVIIKENFNIEDLVYSFYNSFTLAYCELLGRSYGGGVLELSPNEFKSVPVPYVRLLENEFTLFSNRFRTKQSSVSANSLG
jgi:adenine-specific DNA-methyltransferase